MNRTAQIVKQRFPRAHMGLALAAARAPEEHSVEPLLSAPCLVTSINTARIKHDMPGVAPSDVPLEPPNEVPAVKQDSIRVLVHLATFLIIAAGAAVSIDKPIAFQYQVFVCFLIGHTIWLASAILKRDRGLIALNLGLMTLDSYAIFIRL